MQKKKNYNESKNSCVRKNHVQESTNYNKNSFKP